MSGDEPVARDGRHARPVPQIPEKPELSQFMALEDVENASKDPAQLPLGYNEANAEVYSVDLSRTFCYIISGKSRSGKTNVLKVLACTAALKDNSRRAVIDFFRTAERAGGKYRGPVY